MEIEVVSPIEAEAEVKRYTLVSDDIYVRRYDESTIPDWYRSLIDNVLATSGTIGSLETVLNNIQSIQDGYAISISNLETADSSLLANYQTQQTSIDGITSTIANLGLTYATRDYAQTVVDDTIAATFGTNGLATAWFNSNITAYASDIASNASAITTIGSVTNQNSATIVTIQDAVTTLDSAVATAAQYVTATVGGTEVVTGWSLVSSIDPQGDQISAMSIQANDFNIFSQDGLTLLNPFSISGTDISFNGLVTFSNITDANVNQTFTQTTEPTSGMTEGDTWIDTDDGDKVYIYDGTTWMEQGAGGATPQEVVTAINNGLTTTIDGGHITTGSMNANRINAGVLYNTGGNSVTYTMKIDLDNGEIHIK